MTRLIGMVGLVTALVSLAGPADVLGAAGQAAGQRAAAVRDAPGEAIEVLQLRPNFYLIAGAGANVAVQIGEDGVVVTDAGAAENAAAIIAAIQKITALPIRYVINTGPDADHVGGNETVSKAGQTLLGTRVTGLPSSASFNGAGVAPASILAMEQVLIRMSARTGEKAPYSVAHWPTDTIPSGRKNMYLNGEGIEVVHQPAAHTDGDATVFFRRSDVIVAGDILDVTRFPVIDTARGGTIQGELDALNRLTVMAIPSVPIMIREEGTWVIPGHGHLCDQYDVAAYRDMVTIIRDRVRDLKAAGMTIEQVKAAAPAKGYVARFGSDTGPWTTAMFIEAIYRTVAVGR